MPFINTLNPNAGGIQLAPAMTLTSKTYDTLVLGFTPKAGSTYMVWSNADRYAQLNFGAISSGVISFTSLPEDFPISVTLVETTGGVDTYRNIVVSTDKVADCKTNLESSPWAPTWTLNGNGRVTQWTDTSGNGNHFTVAPNFKPPTSKDSGVSFDNNQVMISTNSVIYRLVAPKTPLKTTYDRTVLQKK